MPVVDVVAVAMRLNEYERDDSGIERGGEKDIKQTTESYHGGILSSTFLYPSPLSSAK